MGSILSTLRTDDQSSPARLQHILELDGVRGLAAVGVVFHHLFFTSIPDPERWNKSVQVISSLAHAGGYGVDVFFVLSGFLITSLLIGGRSTPNYYWNFYWKRALRILPLYLVALTALVIASPASWKYVVLSLLFLANYAHLFHVPSNGPFWTLAIEEQFYLAWPQAVRSMRVASIERLAFLLALGCALFRFADAWFGHFNFQFTFFHCDSLALGAALACRRIRQGQTQAERRPNRSVHHADRTFLLIDRCAATTGAAMCVATFALPSSHGFLPFNSALLLTGVALVSYAVIATTVRYSGSRPLAILRSRAITFFGAISYCLYVVNGYVVSAYDSYCGTMQTGNMYQYVLRAVCVFSISVLISVVSRYALELPAMSLRRFVLRG